MRIIDKKLLNLKNDIVFQELFGKQKNSKITEHLLTLILEREIKDIDLDVNKRMLGNRQDSKTGRLDIRAKFNDGEDCDIELQVEPFKYMNKRILEYWAEMFTQKISSGNRYSILKPSIVILIADYKLEDLKELEEYHTVWNLRERKYKDKILTKDIEIHILEMPKIKETETGELALWLRFIKNPRNEGVKEEMEKEGNKYFEQAMKELEYLSGDPDFKRLVEAREGFLRDQEAYKDEGMELGEKIGLQKGKKAGKKEKAKEIAKKMLIRKMPIEDIMELTGLTEEEIKKL